MTDIELRNENGKIVGYDKETGEQIPVSMESLSAESLQSDSAWGEALSAVDDESTVQEVLDAAPEWTGILVPPGTYNESISINKMHQTPFAFAEQSGAALQASGEHTVTTGIDDAHIRGITVNQNDGVFDDPDASTPEQYDAVHVTHSEFRANNVSIDTADRYGYYINDCARCHITAPEIAGGHSAAICLDDAFDCNITDVILQQSVGDGIVLNTSESTGCSANQINGVIRGCAGDGLVVGDGVIQNEIHLTVKNPGGNIATITGEQNTITLTGRNGTVEIPGDRNLVEVDVPDEVHLTGEANNNYVYGRIGQWSSGGLTMDGTENVVTGQFASMSYNATRSVYNGHSQNDGDPRSTGDWSGNAALAHRFGATVWDTSTSPWTEYQPAGDGSGGYEFVQS